MKKILTSLLLFFAIHASSQWALQNSNFPNMATGVACISTPSATVAWAAAFDSSWNIPSLEFTMTSNGGTTWTAGTVNGPTIDYNISCITGVDANTAWVSVADWANGGGRIYQTTDGGANWSRQNNSAFNGAYGWADLIYFWNLNEGVCVGDSNNGYWEIYTTTNGGNNWTRTPSGSIPANLNGEWGEDNVFSIIGNTIWFGTNYGRIYKSTDKGLTWTVAQTPLSAITSMAFRDANNGIAEDGGTLVSTTDGGTTWNTVNYTGTMRDGWMCYASGAGGFYVTTEYWEGAGGSSYSIDDGNTWVDLDDMVDHGAVMFYNSTTGWSGGWNSGAGDGMFVYTGGVGMADGNETYGVTIFPNPMREHAALIISGRTSGVLQLDICDVTGKIIRTLWSEEGRFIIDRNDLADGLYLYVVTSGNTRIASGKLSVSQ